MEIQKEEIQVTPFESSNGTCYTQCPFGMSSKVGAAACTSLLACKHFLYVDRINKEVICTGADRGQFVPPDVQTLPF